jgi:hypothetical protein
MAVGMVLGFGPGQAPHAQSSLPTLRLTANQAVFGPGSTLSVTVGLEHTGAPVLVDLLFGVILPDGDSLVFFEGPALVAGNGRLSQPASLRPMYAGLAVGPGTNVLIPDFFRHTWVGQEPVGEYQMFFAATTAGALRDNRIDGGDLLAVQTATFGHFLSVPPPDTQPPSAPTGLTAAPTSSTAISLGWNSSTDNVGVAGYRLYRNGTFIGQTANTSYVNQGLTASTTYSYTVTAFDAAGNQSLPSAIASATTFAPPPAGANWSSPIPVSGAPAVTTTVTGDFNGDGITDFAAFEGGKHSGTKLFAWFQSPGFIKRNLNPGFATAEFIGSAAVADLNKDGRPDIVFSMDHHSGTTQEGWVYWAENPGGDATGAWPIHLIQMFPSGTEHINDMAIDDVDGDGKLDVVIRHLGVNRVRILFQNSLPGNWTVVTLAVPPREGLSIADLDGDGRKDLLLNGFWLAAPAQPRTGEWLPFNIDTMFYTQPDSGLNNAAKTGVGDIDKDGRIDVVISTAEGATGKFAWYRNPGNPRVNGWTAHVLEANSTGMHQAELGDIDLDGDLDVMNGYAFGQTGVRVYLLNGASFEKKTVTNLQGLYFGKLADLDGDGDLDIVGATTYAGQLYVYLNPLR